MKKIPVYLLLIVSILVGCNPANRRNTLSKENIVKGETLFRDLGCIACHSVTGEKKYGPSLNNILNKEVEVIRQGRIQTIKIDKNYIRRSILEPGFEKVSSFKKQTMPVPAISQGDLNYLVDYLIYINLKDMKE